MEDRTVGMAGGIVSRSVLVVRPVWPVRNRLAEELSAAGYAIEYAGAWDALLAEEREPQRFAAVLLGEYQPERLPAQLVRPTNGRLLWLVDQAAARHLRLSEGSPRPAPD